jgi:cyclopropane fatty-acyl-phospholipid synthase-like methyltransferase
MARLRTARFSWTYRFHLARRVARPVVAAFVRTMWAGYLAGCADRCVALAEQSG